MKRFLLKICLCSLAVVVLLGILILVVPKDNLAYINEYNKKVDIIRDTKQPRLIFIGPSSLAFGLNSRLLSDSLDINVINMGLHAGIGLRYPLEDFLQYAQKGDIVIIQPSYSADFKLGGNGAAEGMIDLMVATNWRNFSSLSYQQIDKIIEGIPFFCYRNLVRLIKSPLKGFDTPIIKGTYNYIASGFNEYGDEESHWYIPLNNNSSKKNQNNNLLNETKVPNDFMEWLIRTINKYKDKGCKVFIMPEIGTQTSHANTYFENIQHSLKREGLSFICDPEYMVLNDNYMYNVEAHLNHEGTIIMSNRLVPILRECIRK